MARVAKGEVAGGEREGAETGERRKGNRRGRERACGGRQEEGWEKSQGLGVAPPRCKSFESEASQGAGRFEVVQPLQIAGILGAVLSGIPYKASTPNYRVLSLQ